MQRGSKPFLVMFGYVVVLTVIALGILDWMQNSTGSAIALQQSAQYVSMGSVIVSQWARRLFMALSFAQLVMIVMVVPAYSAGIVSTEREKGTLDMLKLTLLSSSEIIWQKLVAALGQTMLLIIASLPVMSIVFLLGGVSPFEVLLAYIIIVFTAILVGALGLLFSCLLKNTTSATFATYLTAFLFFAGTPIAGALLPNALRGGMGDSSALMFTASVGFSGGVLALMAYGPVVLIMRKRTPRWQSRTFRMATFGATYALVLLALNIPILVEALIKLVFLQEVFLPVYVNSFFAMMMIVSGADGTRLPLLGYVSGMDWLIVALTLFFCAGCAFAFKKISTLRFEAMRRS